jgi:hypothetical protein
MATIQIPPRTAPERLHWLSLHSWHPSQESRGLRYLILPALLAVILLIIGLGIVIATAATEMFQLYSNWLQSLSRPGPWQ